MDNTSCNRVPASRSCTARRHRKRRHRMPYRPQSHEHFSTIHRTPDRDRAADGRITGGRPHRLSAIAGGVASERQLSDAFGHGAAAGRRPADHGIHGGLAARAAVRRDPRPHPDDVVQRTRLCPGHPAVRFEPPHRWGGRRHIVGDQCVGLVGVGGEQQPTVRVQVDPEALAARGINLEDVRTVLGQANVDLPKGTLNSPRQTYTLNTNDQLFKPDKYDDLVIAYRNGSPVRIRDIGHAVSAGENELISAWFNQKRAIILAVQRQPGANVIETVGRIKAMLPVLQASIPAAVKVNVISDRTQTIRASVADVQFTLMLTVALVVMVIFIFLRNFWATIIPAVTVPLALVGTFAVLYGMGYSLDNLSLMALSIAV